MQKRTICVFTGTRAEYGLLKPLISKINEDEGLNLKLIVSGMHLSPEFGLTYRIIEKDGFYIDEKVDILLSSDTKVGTSKSIGLGIISFSEVLNRFKPDISVILGDRFEAFAFAISNYILNIPIAHLYGGELTYSLIDDGIRHSITKLSYLHFCSTEVYRKRVIQLGEDPNRVFNVGAIGIDNIRELDLMSKEEIEQTTSIKFRRRNLLITFHPITLEKDKSLQYFKELLKVLDEFKDTLLIFTKANADSEGRKINKLIEEYVNLNKDKAVMFTNMGQRLYLSTMRYVDAVVGNSSSGIIEAPSFKIPTINITDRQKGRVKARSVIDCNAEYSAIKEAFKIAFSKDFRDSLKDIKNPYGEGNSAYKILKVLKSYPLTDIKKHFFDVNFNIT